MFRRGLVRGKVGGDRRNNEPEYEEVGPPTALKRNQEKRGDGHHCDLCGSMEAAVRCDRCGSQAFCLSCDDMYHRHPRRSSHFRKAVDSLNSTGGGVRPPLPPKGEGQGAPPPQPPPRKNKRAGFLSSTGFSKKDQNYQYSTGSGHGSYRSASLTNLQSASSEAGGSAGRTIMGSLKRFMGARPLPPTPDQAKSALKNERPSSVAPKILTRANTSPSLPNLSEPLSNEDIRAGLPQSVLEINRTRLPNNSTSTPVTPASAHAQYPPLQPKTQPSNAHTQSLGRKFSLQQLPQSFDDKRTSMVEGTPGSLPWDAEAPKPATRNRSQSVSDDQWAQMMAAQVSGGNTDLSGPTCPPGHTPADMSAFAGATTRRSFNTMGGGTRSVSSLGRGMVSSASVCDLNTLAQQQTQHGFNNSHGANSFQQLNMMGYNNGMMWGAPCDLCQGPGMYPGHPTAGGMKRTASNLSMNLSSVGSDVSGYPWGPPPPHMHHHMPPMYLGYYPGYHPHMGPPPMGSGMGLNMSIPDSMHTFGKVPSSPAPSLRSSSHRSHKSSKSRSFSAADTSGRSSRARKLKRSEESAESRSSSVTDDDEIEERESKSGHHSSSIAWQCDHCTFINSGGARTCGMCSKTVGTSGRNTSRRGSERRRSERRRDRRTDHEDDERDVSDYDNDGGVVKSNLSFNIKDSKRDTRTKVSGSSKSKSKKKSRRRSSSASDSESGSEGEDERLERHMKDLRLSSSSSRRRGSDYEGINHKDKDRDRERSSRKKEGSSGRFKNRGRSHSERSRTPGRQTPRPASPVDDIESGELSPESSPPDIGQGQIPNNNKNELNGSPNETVIDGDASETTMKNEGKSRSGSRDRRYEIKKERAPTPPPSPVEENVQETNPENALIPEVMNGNKSRSCSPRLQVPKGRSPARSVRNSKGDVDEPSFANTLDDITTIGTNEVADQDFSQYIDEHLQSASEHPQLEEPHEDVPVFNYIRPESPEEEVIEEAKTIGDVPNPVATVNKNNDAQGNEIVTKDTGQTEQKPEVIPYSVYEPRYEPIEEPAQFETSPAGDSGQAGIQIQVQSQGGKEEAEDNNEIGTLEKFLKAHEGKQGSPLVLRNIDVARASSGSSLGHSSPPERDRQYTPLSCSSSDAQFYSPPDSPDLSLSEQLKDVPATSQTQAFTLNQDGRPTNISQTFRSGEDESYLVTALESMQTMTKAAEDLKSSRETIRSSMEQLPYSEEDLLLSSAFVYDNTTKEMSYGIISLRQEADRQARAAAWSKEDLSEKYMTVEEIITKRRQKVMETQGLQLVQVLRDAEDAGYTSEEVSIALTHCGDKSPLEWMKENWKHMVDTVLTLATNYGHERRVNDIGSISANEARIALRIHKGNIWAAVTECVEQRQKKFNEIYSRGKFKRADVVKALETHSGDVDAAFLEVNKSQLKPFLMKIWGSMSPSPSLAKGTQSPVPAVSSSASNEVSSSPTPSRSTTKEVGTSQTTQTDKDITAWVEDDDDDDDDDDEDVFENVYANIKPLREEPHPPPDQLYANVNIASKKMKLVKESVKSKKLAKKAIQKQEQDEDELFTASETAGIESDEESTIEELLADAVSPNYYEYFTAVDLDDEEVYEDEDEEDTEEEEEERYYDEDGEVEEFEESDDDNDETETEGVENDVEEEDEDIYEYRDAVFSDAEGDSDPLEEAFSDPQSGEEEEEVQDDAQNDDQFEELQFVRKEDIEDDQGKESPYLDEPGMAQTRQGPVTFQKASVIVGKAIAKAMARETSARESQSRSVTPEGQENTLTTPEPSEGEEDTTGQVTVSDSDDEDHLRTLDTIPEEEEISERTESKVSRSASRNLFLPFNPTDIIQLSPVAKALNKLTGAKTVATKAKSKELSSGSIDSTPGTPHAYYNATQQNTYYNESGSKNDSQQNAYYNESGGKNATQQNAYYNESGGKNAAQQNAYYNESGGKNYYNEATGKNYYNESGAKMEGVVSEKQPPDDYESMAEVKEKSDASTLKMEVSVDAPVASPPTPDMKEDEEEEVIYYEEVFLKTDEKPSDENKSESSTTRRRRRRRRKSRGHGSGTSETYSRADVVESPVGDDSAPAAIASTPSPTPAAVPEPSKERSPSADYSTVTKSAGRTSALSDSKSYSIIEMVKPTESTSKPTVTSSSGESEEEGEGPEKAEMIEGLKARHNKEPDYQEVRELKEQIQMMRKQLEARMEEEDTETRPDTPETPQEEQPPQGPLLLLQGSPTAEGPPREYEQLKFDRTVRRLLAEGQAGSYEKAELAAQLMNFNFDEYDSLQAAEECSSIYTAIQFLQQECELCAEKYPMGKMVSMLQCTHRCCRECAKTYFTFQIKTKNIRDLRCPFCNEPDLDDCEEIANEYLNNMDILLKNIIDAETHELFQRKLRDWTLMKDPNFRWCNKCSSGFIANPRARKLICPDCKDVTCAQCRATWESSHEGISCEAFARWKVDNDLEVQAQGVARHLAENGITCPKCKFTYSLAKGGCMHFTCTQCKYEFCSGCGEPFRQGAKCPIGPYCERMGLHAHHPRNCLFYLRDKEPHQLQNLLKDAGIGYDTEDTQVRDPNKTRVLCMVQEQKELPDGLKDDICGRIVPNGYAGLCKLHYTEYLVEKINTHKLDPVSIFDEADLRVCLRRNGKPVPVRRWESEKLYRDKLIKLIKEHLPLDASEQ